MKVCGGCKFFWAKLFAMTVLRVFYVKRKLSVIRVWKLIENGAIFLFFPHSRCKLLRMLLVVVTIHFVTY